ncbi:hypothetical protein GNX71_12935 [Variovorax sp. RKNM96]|uniref:hypothetical protein n=1 Tax=Variovorax sp. RKNM96 TaxID=2681552 RepID=UPI001980265D|nr:hypothetical protein [Variovorax sp. RKNM96]QSI30440.1 hypothetical protein GNX71_12935 [Variovorax sp. RKNM96]
MNSTRLCAYCAKEGPLTREHIWPGGIIARAKGINTSYFGRLEKFIDAELTIKDVCADCNNGPLSGLDAYICHLFDTQFCHPVACRKSRTFVYDYERLLRWLLKISFNTARANDSDVGVLSNYAGFILEGGEPPSEVRVCLELIHASPNPKWSPGSNAMKEIPAASIRCARVETPADPLPGATLRLVALYGFYFWIVLTPAEVDIAALQGLPGKLLPPNKTKLSLHPSRGMLELHADWVRNPRASQSMRELRARRAR